MDRRQQYNDQFSGQVTLHKLIKVVDTSSDDDLNLALIDSTKIKRADAEVAVTYLKQNFYAKYGQQIDTAFVSIPNKKKKQLFYQVIKFVHITIPTLCMVCDTDYVPMYQADSDNGVVECIRCKVSAHNTCYKLANFNKDQGKVYMCQVCIQTIGKDKVDEAKEDKAKEKVEVNKHDEDEDTEESSEEDSSSDEDEREKGKFKKVEKKKRTKKSSKKTEICPNLLEGVCPHGASGKECEYLHKKKCNRFINYGTKEMHPGGCRFGDECHYLHPKLCQNSVMMKSCYNKSCKLAHLKSTKKNIPKTENLVSNGRNNGRNNTQRSSSFQQQQSYGQRSYEQRSYGQRNNDHRSNDQHRSKPAERSRNQQNYWGSNSSQYTSQNPFLEERMQKIEQNIIQNVKQLIATQLYGAEEFYDQEYPLAEGGW